MRLKIFSPFFSLLIIAPALALATAPLQQKNQSTPNNKIVESEAGLNIPEIGIAIDSVYEKRLDNLIPGFKLLLVVVSNKTSKPIYFDPKKDQWGIRDHLNQLHRGFNHPRSMSKKTWDKLPPGLKQELEYPQIIHDGNTAKIDLLFPISVELENFRTLVWKSVYFKKEFRLQSATDNTNHEMATPATISSNAETILKTIDTYQDHPSTPPATEQKSEDSKPESGWPDSGNPEPERRETTIPID